MKIKDKCLEPYHINVTENSYNVVVTELNSKNKEVSTTYGYFSELDGALRKVAKLKIKDNIQVTDIEGYFDFLHSYLEEFKNKVKV